MQSYIEGKGKFVNISNAEDISRHDGTLEIRIRYLPDCGGSFGFSTSRVSQVYFDTKEQLDAAWEVVKKFYGGSR